MTTVKGYFRLPYGPGGSSPTDGCLTFTRKALASEAGAILLPTTFSTPISQGAMEPVELAAGLWSASIRAEGRVHPLPDLLVEGEELTLTADPVPADGTYLLQLAENQAITHTGDGTYEIGEI